MTAVLNISNFSLMYYNQCVSGVSDLVSLLLCLLKGLSSASTLLSSRHYANSPSFLDAEAVMQGNCVSSASTTLSTWASCGNLSANRDFPIYTTRITPGKQETLPNPNLVTLLRETRKILIVTITFIFSSVCNF